VDALEEGVEGEGVILRDDEFSVEDEVFRLELREGVDDFGEVACEGLAGLGLEVDTGVVAEGQAAEAVPFGFVLPVGADGESGNELGVHGGIIEG